MSQLLQLLKHYYSAPLTIPLHVKVMPSLLVCGHISKPAYSETSHAVWTASFCFNWEADSLPV